MTFRIRLLFAFLAAVLIPMIALSLFLRGEMSKRMTGQYERRVNALVGVLEEDLIGESQKITAALTVITGAAATDNRFRQATVDRDVSARRYLLDYAGNAMRLTGLSYLQIEDGTGRIISSGHFRNEFDRIERSLPYRIAEAPNGFALLEARAPDVPFLALVSVDSFQLADETFHVVAGVHVGKSFLLRLARDDELSVDLIYPGGEVTSNPGGSDRDTTHVTIARELTAPFVSDEGTSVARFRVSHSTMELDALLHSVDRWFIAAVAAAGIFSVLLVSWLASRISRPISELAEKTARLDLDRLDVDFSTPRRDEIGRLSRLLGEMTDRLRASTKLVKEAERRATLGDVARQVNHDIKNGLTPLRNVLRHLNELSRENPDQLVSVMRERQGTIDSSMTYLENLATNYARLSPRTKRTRCNVNVVVGEVIDDVAGVAGTELSTNLGEGAFVDGDLVSLRRIVENLIGNAIDSLESKTGSVDITTERVFGEDGERVLLTVLDTGIGMDDEQRTRIFEDFYTTKATGTGLGLSIVRRLVMDLGGTIRVESEPGAGSKFVVDLPAAEA